MCRAVQRNLVPRRCNVRHQRQIALVGVLRADKKGGRDLLPIKDFQNRHGIFARSVIKGQADHFGQRRLPGGSRHGKTVVGGVGIGIFTVVQPMNDAEQQRQQHRRSQRGQQPPASFLPVCIAPHGKPLPCYGLVKGMRARREIDTQRRGMV